MNHQYPGKFITVEGGDGVGKDFIIERIKEYLQQLGILFVSDREPGGTQVGAICRALLKFTGTVHEALDAAFADNADWQANTAHAESANPTAQELRLPSESEVLIFGASRVAYVRERVIPTLAQGKAFIGNRGHDSTTAYQGGGRFDNDPKMLDFIRHMNEIAMQGVMPDITFLLDAPIEIALARLMRDRSELLDIIERHADSEFRQRIRRGYLLAAEAEPNRIVVIDASVSKDEVWAQIVPHLDRLFLNHLTH